MKIQLNNEIKNRIAKVYEEFLPLINKYAKTEPEISYNYFDGHYMSVWWRTEVASVEFMVYQGSADFNACLNNDLEWMEINASSGFGTLESFGKRTEIKDIEIEEYIAKGFEWLYKKINK